MSLQEPDLKRISEKIALDRADHDRELSERFTTLELRLKDLDHDLKATRNGMVGVLDVIKEDLKPALDSLVDDQTFVRNVRRFLTWVGTPVIAVVVWFWPHLVEFVKSGKW